MLKEVSLKIAENISITLAWCPPGHFKIGVDGTTLCFTIKSKEALVSFNKGFWIGTTPITCGIWNLVMDNKSHATAATPDRALYGIDYGQAMSFIERLNKRIRLYTDKEVTCALPNYLEWQYACVGKQQPEEDFYIKEGIKEFSKYAWFNENSNDNAHNVAEKAPNPWGLYDMYGNVLEICLDVIPAEDTPIVNDPVSILDGDTFTVLGGDFYSNMEQCLSLEKRPIAVGNSFQEAVGLRLILKDI